MGRRSNDEPDLGPAATQVSAEAGDPAELGPRTLPLQDRSREAESPASDRASGAKRRPAPLLPSDAAPTLAVPDARHTPPGSAREPAAARAAASDHRGPALRRNESVLQEAARARNNPLRWIAAAAQALGRWARRAVAVAGFAAVRRFERMPRWQQALWVAAPYASAVALGAFLLAKRGHAVSVAGRPAVFADGATSIVRSEEAVAVKAPPAIPVDAVPASRAEATPEPAALRFKTRVVALARASALYIRPDPKVGRSARLRPGHVVTLYPDFPCPEGWVLGQSERGTIGFISALHIEGKPDPAIDEARRSKRRRRRRTRTR